MRRAGIVIAVGYELAGWTTFTKLAFFDDYVYNSWNWLIAVPVDAFMGQIWPIYWLIIRPIFGK